MDASSSWEASRVGVRRNAPTTCYVMRGISCWLSSKPSHVQTGRRRTATSKDYAAVLGIKFAYSTNGHGIVEFDYTTGKERELESFPSPKELWDRYRINESLTDKETADKLLTPSNTVVGKGQRYYQEIAINRA